MSSSIAAENNHGSPAGLAVESTETYQKLVSNRSKGSEEGARDAPIPGNTEQNASFCASLITKAKRKLSVHPSLLT